MIALLPFKQGNVLALHVSEKIEHKDIHVYVEVESFTGISPAALIEDVTFALPNFTRFTKKAVVSETTWMAKITPWANKIFPSIQIKHFTPEEKGVALAWIQK
ncbi:MAG: STAS/SEC14 domain-containing protein [Desulfoplanes sp.]|nr:STAS/SEC14 domain-containing protein [Desulfoplanes sp.]